MSIDRVKTPCFAVLAVLGLCLIPVFGQSKPSESASKVRKVLLYNKIGGWVATHGIAAVESVMTGLAAAKGFELVRTAEDSVLTLDFLKQFQAIVWNNNTDGAASVPSMTARQAVLDYLEQGGGWLLICNAGDHQNRWSGLAERMGTTFHRHASTGRAEVVLDADARGHRELKWMVQGFPDAFVLTDLFLSFQNTVRPLPGVTVVATTRGIPGVPYVIVPVADGSGDNVYLWAREVGQGRLFYNAIGFGFNRIMAQQDSIVPRLYWENLRYVAGDYRNGCTTPGRPGYDPSARVHVEALCATTGVVAGTMRFVPEMAKAGPRIRLSRPLPGPFTVRVRDIRGAVAWKKHLPAGTDEIVLDGAVGRGVRLFELQGAAGTFRSRLLLP